MISGVDDANDLASTRKAFSLLGINEVAQMGIFRVLAAILHLGNIEIGGSDRAEIYSNDISLLGELMKAFDETRLIGELQTWLDDECNF